MTTTSDDDQGQTGDTQAGDATTDAAGTGDGEAGSDAAGDDQQADDASDASGDAGDAGDAAGGEGDGAAGDGDGKDKPKTAKQRRAELAKDPDVKRIAKQAADAAVRTALKAEAEKAELEKERAKMEATERLAAEKADLEKERDAAASAKADAEFQLTFYKQLVGSGKTLVDADAVDFVRMKVSKRLEEGSDMEDAVQTVLDENPYLVKTETTPKPAPARTQPAKDKKTEQPATTPENKGVDVSKMTPQQFREHLRTTHGIESTH